ncbi:hypothetical protein RHF56_20385, partial [Clostridioides difficile]|nr:hypothetical protein [Clostridioides difficile]
MKRLIYFEFKKIYTQCTKTVAIGLLALLFIITIADLVNIKAYSTAVTLTGETIKAIKGIIVVAQKENY